VPALEHGRARHEQVLGHAAVEVDAERPVRRGRGWWRRGGRRGSSPRRGSGRRHALPGRPPPGVRPPCTTTPTISWPSVRGPRRARRAPAACGRWRTRRRRALARARRRGGHRHRHACRPAGRPGPCTRTASMVPGSRRGCHRGVLGAVRRRRRPDQRLAHEIDLEHRAVAAVARLVVLDGAPVREVGHAARKSSGSPGSTPSSVGVGGGGGDGLEHPAAVVDVQIVRSARSGRASGRRGRWSASPGTRRRAGRW
jgi:hypothetical protein